MDILFVCTGNTCRSNMAEALFRDILEKDSRARHLDIKIHSAGTGAVEGLSSAPLAVEVLKEREIDLSSHRTKALFPDMVERADLIFTMSKRHKDEVLRMAPRAKDKVFILKEFTSLKDLMKAALNSSVEVGGDLSRKVKELKRIHGDTRERFEEIEEEMGALRESLPQSLKEKGERFFRPSEDPFRFDIADPVGKDIQAYRKCVEELESELLKLAELLMGA
ncbi:MAG TPA: hypothetical protein DCW86_01455 [Actinobacteria bacterium]|nr:hypothetical protein [Actinomycetota bacterium]